VTECSRVRRSSPNDWTQTHACGFHLTQAQDELTAAHERAAAVTKHGLRGTANHQSNAVGESAVIRRTDAAPDLDALAARIDHAADELLRASPLGRLAARAAA
jgi:hypothetical protein